MESEQDFRLNTPLQQRHDELERMQAALRNMPMGGRLAGQTEVGGSRRIGGQLPVNMCAGNIRTNSGVKPKQNGNVDVSPDLLQPSPAPLQRARLAALKQPFDHMMADDADGPTSVDRFTTGRAAFGDDIVAFKPSGHRRRDSSAPHTGGPQSRVTHPSLPTSPPSDNSHAGTLGYIMNELRTHCPLLSSAFTCSADDAVILLNAISSASRSDMRNAQYGQPANEHAAYVSTLEDKCVALEAEVRSLTTRLERRVEECDKLRDDVGEARQRARAIETSAKQQQGMLAQRREEMRKQLLTEEGRTSKLTHQNKLLQQELDKLKIRLTNIK